jgi:hypothetical protein
VPAFLDGTFTAPGAQVDVFTAQGIADPTQFDALIDNLVAQPPEADGIAGGPAASVCTRGVKANFPADLGTTSDGGFTGRFEKLTGCKGAGSLFVIFAVPDDKSFIVQVVIQTVTPEDEAAAPTIAGSIIVTNFN